MRTLASLILSLILFFGTANITFANQVDSLLLLVENSNDNKQKVNLYNKIANIFFYKNDTSEAHKYFNIAYNIADKIDDKIGMAISWQYKIKELTVERKFEEALLLIKNDLDLVNSITALASDELLDLKYLEASSLEIKGWVKTTMGHYYEGVSYFIQALEIYVGMPENSNKQISILLNIGYAYEKVGDYDLADAFYDEAKGICKEINNYNIWVHLCINKGYNLLKKGSYKKALVEYEEGLNLMEAHHITNNKSDILYGIAFCQMELGETDEALINFEQSRKLYSAEKHEEYESYCSLFIAKIKFMNTKNPALLLQMKQSYEIGVKYQNLELKQYSAAALAEANASIGRYNIAYQQTKLAYQLQDSISDADLLLKIRGIDSKSQFKISQRKNENEKNEAILNAQLANQKKISYLLFGFTSLLLVGGFLLFKAFKTTSTVKEQLVVNNTALAKTEQRLSKSNKEMKRYIDLNVELEQFAHIVSHDIKSPLSTIQGFIQILKLRFYKQADNREKTFFDFVEKGIKSLNLLVDDLLQYSKSDTKKLNISQIQFNKIVDDVILSLDFSISQAKATIKTKNCDFIINADEIKMKQILQNLLSNALKFKKDDRLPIISIEAKEEQNAFVISVKDNGIGIAEENFKEVFQKFSRLNNNSKFEGSGLGLSICVKYVKKHKGEISIRRNSDYGVTFIFSVNKYLASDINKVVEA